MLGRAPAPGGSEPGPEDVAGSDALMAIPRTQAREPERQQGVFGAAPPTSLWSWGSSQRRTWGSLLPSRSHGVVPSPWGSWCPCWPEPLLGASPGSCGLFHTLVLALGFSAEYPFSSTHVCQAGALEPWQVWRLGSLPHGLQVMTLTPQGPHCAHL